MSGPNEFAGLKPIRAPDPPPDQAAAVPPSNEFAGLKVFDPEAKAEAENEAKYGGTLEGAKTLAEQTAAGASLGASKVAETKLFGVDPKDIAGREAAHPYLSTLGNVAGTAGLIYGTGGLGAFSEGATAAGRIGTAALEGAGIGGVSQITDDWSQNKALDAQKIAASAGLGALLGGGGVGLLEGGSALYKGIRGFRANLPETVGSAAAGSLAPVDVIPPEGMSYAPPKSLQEIRDRVAQARLSGNALDLPQRSVLQDALSRVELEHPVNALQVDSLTSQDARDAYRAAKELPSNVGQVLNAYEGLQKGELVGKAVGTIQELAPGARFTSDAAKGGREAIDAFTNQYQAEQKGLAPLFQNFKTEALGESIDHLPGMVEAMSEAVPGVSRVFDHEAGGLKLIKENLGTGLADSTFNAVKRVVKELEAHNPETVEQLLNVRKTLDNYANVLEQGEGPAQIRRLKAALMNYTQDVSENPEIRDTLKRYAINEQQRGVIEKNFGASVGSPEFGSISKVKPEYVGDNLFKNTANVAAAKKILPPKAFNKALGNWLSENIEKVTADGNFSSRKFTSFLRENQDALKVAFADDPAKLKRLQDLMTITRILPDSAPINPSGTAKTIARAIKDFNVHNLTWEGLAGLLPKKVFQSIAEAAQIRDLNQRLAGQAAKESATQILQKRVENSSKAISTGVRLLFSGSASEARKAE